MPRSRYVALLSAATLVAGTLAAGEITAVAAERTPQPWAPDATGQVRVERGGDGRVTFLGTPAGASITNPDVPAGAPARAAARAHLRSYGSPFGLDVAGLTVARTHHVLGRDLVTFQQHVEGVPVLGGEVAVTMETDRELNSMLSTTSGVTSTSPARVSEATARSMARQVAERYDVTGV